MSILRSKSNATKLSLDHNIPMILIRKERKEYGTNKLIEGVYKNGQTCLMLDDVITTGSSLSESIKLLEVFRNGYYRNSGGSSGDPRATDVDQWVNGDSKRLSPCNGVRLHIPVLLASVQASATLPKEPISMPW